MAMAGKLTIVQSQHIRELAEINPDHVHTPGIFVNRVLHVPYGDPKGFLISDYAASVLASDPISDLTFSASACVAGLYTTIPKSGRPSSAKAEYSNAMGPAIGCRNCFSPSP